MHIPVLGNRISELLQISSGQMVVDGTLGLGGHTKIFAEGVGPTGRVIGIEWDPRNLEKAQKNLHAYTNITLCQDNYKNTTTILETIGLIGQIDIFFLDLGISSPHVDEAARGFSYIHEGPLDMRFDPNQVVSAAQVVNTTGENELADIFYRFGEEPHSRRIAKRIVQARQQSIIRKTTELTALILSALPKNKHAMSGVSRIFQALRIYVNKELENIVTGLQAGFNALKQNGRLAVISYHSLEDRIVKNFFRDLGRTCHCPPEQLRCTCDRHPLATVLTKKPIIPDSAEQQVNPRARSARLRILQKLSPFPSHG